MGKNKAKRRREEEGDLALKENIPRPPEEDTGLKGKTQPSTEATAVTESSQSFNIGSIDLAPLLQNLTEIHQVIPMSVISSSSIERKVTKALEHLSTYPYQHGIPPVVVVLYARSGAAHKMISIVEIVKREIAQAGGKWYQYTTVHSSLEVRQNTAKAERKQGDDGDADMNMASEDDAEGFETMKTPFERAIEGKPKVKTLIIMAVYLSRVRIDGLKKIHGESRNT